MSRNKIDPVNAPHSETQAQKILAWLKSGHKLTALEALNRFGCMRLASRISDLAKSHKIRKQMITVGRGKKAKRVMQYFI